MHYSGLLSGIRTGLYRDAGNLAQNEFECTDDGAYFMHVYLNILIDSVSNSVPFLFYADHNTDTVIKLCGWPDCAHNTLDCNAAFLESYGGISYYGGYLYTAQFSAGPEVLILNRMDPDGNNQVKVMDFENVASGKYTYFDIPYVLNGIFLVPMTGVDAQTGEKIRDLYYYKLDGTMAEPEQMNLEYPPTSISSWMWNDGEAFLYQATVPSQDGQSDQWRLYRWYPDTNAVEQLASMPVTEDTRSLIRYATWGAQVGLIHQDGKVLKINYPTCDTEVLFETGIQGHTTSRYYPDSLAVLELAEAPYAIHLYRYDGEDLGTVTLPDRTDGSILLGESRDRIYVGTSLYLDLPSYYIDKSEYGTGHIELHEFQYPDLNETELAALFDGKNPYDD